MKFYIQFNFLGLLWPFDIEFKERTNNYAIEAVRLAHSKIHAIKILRDTYPTFLPLKEAKDMIDEVWDREAKGAYL